MDGYLHWDWAITRSAMSTPHLLIWATKWSNSENDCYCTPSSLEINLSMVNGPTSGKSNTNSMASSSNAILQIYNCSRRSSWSMHKILYFSTKCGEHMQRGSCQLFMVYTGCIR